MRDVYNALTAEQRRWVAEAARLRQNARLPRARNFDDDQPRDTRVSDAAHSEWAARKATDLPADTLDALLDFLGRYLPLHGDGSYPAITADAPWRCPTDGAMVNGADETCHTCTRRDAEARQHAKRMQRVSSRIEAEGLGATAGTRNAVTVDGLALDVLLDEVDLLREEKCRYQDAIDEAEEARRSA